MAGGNTYSQLVDWLKLVLPLIAIGILSTLFLLSEAPDPERALPYAEVDVAQLARELRLSQPRFAGVTPEGREITLTAEAAAPDFDTTDVIVTDRIEGRIALADEGFVTVEALVGRIDIAAQIADLSGGVEALTDAGYRLISDAVRLRLAETGLSAPGDVRIEGPGIELTAGTMEYGGDAGAEVLSFTGGVRLLYQPED